MVGDGVGGLEALQVLGQAVVLSLQVHQLGLPPHPASLQLTPLLPLPWISRVRLVTTASRGPAVDIQTSDTPAAHALTHVYHQMLGIRLPGRQRLSSHAPSLCWRVFSFLLLILSVFLCTLSKGIFIITLIVYLL